MSRIGDDRRVAGYQWACSPQNGSYAAQHPAVTSGGDVMNIREARQLFEDPKSSMMARIEASSVLSLSDDATLADLITCSYVMPRQEGVLEIDGAAYAEGVQAAKADIGAGRLQYRSHGHSGHWGHWIVSALEKRFGVGVNDGFGVCFVSKSQVSFDRGYNATLAAEINRRHGEGAFEAVFAESRQQSEEALGDAKRAWLDRHAEA